jgi:hypothetical protein
MSIAKSTTVKTVKRNKLRMTVKVNPSRNP